jgi:hypothetical protein
VEVEGGFFHGPVLVLRLDMPFGGGNDLRLWTVNGGGFECKDRVWGLNFGLIRWG